MKFFLSLILSRAPYPHSLSVSSQFPHILSISSFFLHFLILFPFPHSLSISSFSVHFVILCPFPHSLSISSFSFHFLILCPFPHSPYISSFSLHFLSISSSFPHSLSISSQPVCKAATTCAALHWCAFAVLTALRSVNLKGSSTKKNFYRLNLIFWIVMGCGIADFDRRGL